MSKKYTVKLKNTLNGFERTVEYESDLDPETEYSYWAWGNYSCDCNRSRLLNDPDWKDNGCTEFIKVTIFDEGGNLFLIENFP
jgi:hypothetical protein